MAFNYPWTNLHELNLNWILSQIKQITRQIANFAGLTATAHTIPQNEDPTVTLTGGTGNTPYNFDFGIPASPASTVTTVNGQSGDVVITASDIGLGNVDNVQQYSATNPPPYPVTSVNGQTGDVSLGELVDCASDLTPVADVVIESAYYTRVGHLITYVVTITATSTIPASTEVFRGLIQPVETMNAGVKVLNGIVIPITAARNSGTGIGFLVFQNSIPSGRMSITFSYITQS